MSQELAPRGISLAGVLRADVRPVAGLVADSADDLVGAVNREVAELQTVPARFRRSAPASTSASSPEEEAAPPEPAAVWQGTRLAKAYSPQAMQATIFGLPLGQTSEDCLYLNVWTPAKEPSAGFRTVMKRCWKPLLPDRIVLIG